METKTRYFNSKLIGSVLAGIGFFLSPLSWWNDLVINIPLAYLMASLVGIIFPGYFAMFMIIGYWLTNVLGLVLMHRGGQLALGKEKPIYSLHSIITDLFISLIYSLIIGVLVVSGILKLPTEYF